MLVVEHDSDLLEADFIHDQRLGKFEHLDPLRIPGINDKNEIEQVLGDLSQHAARRRHEKGSHGGVPLPVARVLGQVVDVRLRCRPHVQ